MRKNWVTNTVNSITVPHIYGPNSASAPSLSFPLTVLALYITVLTQDFHTLPLLLIAPLVYHLRDKDRCGGNLLLKKCKNVPINAMVFQLHVCACWTFCMAAVSFTFLLSLFPTSLTEILLGRLKTTVTNQRKRH